ncbi:hypothetical protein [Candidatus Gromoviella agglomerans]|uniref:hypothetical protein n=1 Tax=Candidatus Gromoviella agglomerans TaxID=2806609 RepID=UPI001E52E549|nr:hypothetical protein [Candidatus Gromoviella agglomerans]UFX98460.1 Putative monovalent cation/H+ antiporter subunit C [Candidatus Gromoviella agglomerans]
MDYITIVTTFSCIIGCGIYTLLSECKVRKIIGLTLLGYGFNLLILACGEFESFSPAFLHKTISDKVTEPNSNFVKNWKMNKYELFSIDELLSYEQNYLVPEEFFTNENDLCFINSMNFDQFFSKFPVFLQFFNMNNKIFAKIYYEINFLYKNTLQINKIAHEQYKLGAENCAQKFSISYFGERFRIKNQKKHKNFCSKEDKNVLRIVKKNLRYNAIFVKLFHVEQFRANFSDIFANLIDSKLTLHKAFSTKNVVTIEKFLDFDKITNLILTKNSTKKMSNPLAQAMILTSIVISLATFMIIISQWIH